MNASSRSPAARAWLIRAAATATADVSPSARSVRARDRASKLSEETSGERKPHIAAKGVSASSISGLWFASL